MGENIVKKGIECKHILSYKYVSIVIIGCCRVFKITKNYLI